MSTSKFSIPVVQILLFLFLCFGLVTGLFNQTTCGGSNCIQKNSKDIWCFAPDPHDITAPNCTGAAGHDPAMNAVLNVHLKQGLSIAYYDGVDNSLLGGVDFPFPTSGGIVRLCVSGKGGDGVIQTLCENVHQDNAIAALDAFCIVSVGQDFVSDGCYVPASGVVVVDGQSTTLASTSSSTIRLSSSTTHLSTSTALHPATPALTTLVGATVTTISSKGIIQTVVVAPQVTANSDGSSYTEDFVLPIILSLFGLLLVALGVFVWWYKKRTKERAAGVIPPPALNVYVPPPTHQQGDGRSNRTTPPPALGVYVPSPRRRYREVDGRSSSTISPPALDAYVPPPQWHPQEDEKSSSDFMST